MIQRTGKNNHPEGGICEQFAFSLKMVRYPNSSDITELDEIAGSIIKELVICG